MKTVKKILLLLLSGPLLINCSNDLTMADNLRQNLYTSLESNSADNISFVSNQDYLPSLLKLFNMPDIKTIDLIHYNFFTENNGSTQVILANLIRLKAKGVRIRIILEGKRADPNKRNSLTLKKLQDAGITDVKLETKFTTHDKSICFNSKYLLAGSTNWTNTSMDKNNETDAIVVSDSLGQAYSSYFEKIWNGANSMVPTITTDGDTDLLTDSSYYEALKAVISRAESSIDIGTYFLAYRKGHEAEDFKVKEILDLIIAKNNEAKSNGKNFRVRFFVDNNGISPQDYQTFTINAAVNARDYLAKNGVTEFFFDKYEQISHCKFLIKDAGGQNPEVIFGSTNLSKDDFDQLHQVNFRTANPETVNAFSHYMDARLKESTKEPLVPGNKTK